MNCFEISAMKLGASFFVIAVCNVQATALWSAQDLLPGFEPAPFFSEQELWARPMSDVTLRVNAPGPDQFDHTKETRFIYYMLPNGNSINETVGSKNGTGVDWHFLIQQIGAQVRRTREVLTDQNWIVAYLEADSMSWPTWSETHPHSDAAALVSKVYDLAVSPAVFSKSKVKMTLASHSGGGAFLFDYMNATAGAMLAFDRLVFLDSDYDFDETPAYGDDLVRWLLDDDSRHLSVVCYDDRNITVDGKKITPPWGGTWRHTHHMMDRFSAEPLIDLRQVTTNTTNEPIQVYIGLSTHDNANGEALLSTSGSNVGPAELRHRVDIRLHENPDNLILHTVLVYSNGFIHGITAGEQSQDKPGIFFGPIEFDKWIQPATTPN